MGGQLLTSMLAFIIIALGSTAGLVTIRALRNAADGFEDDRGFHPAAPRSNASAAGGPLPRGSVTAFGR